MIGYTYSDQDRELKIVLEYMSAGNLFSYITFLKKTEREKIQNVLYKLVLLDILYQISCGMRYLHEHLCIVQLDLKMENILLHKTSRVVALYTAKESDPSVRIPLVKISDFGVSQRLSKPYNPSALVSSPFNTKHLPHYIDPLLREGGLVNLYKADVYMFGSLSKDLFLYLF